MQVAALLASSTASSRAEPCRRVKAFYVDDWQHGMGALPARAIVPDKGLQLGFCNLLGGSRWNLNPFGQSVEMVTGFAGNELHTDKNVQVCLHAWTIHVSLCNAVSR